jgi:cell wall-associated NlpC family hydrolase
MGSGGISGLGVAATTVGGVLVWSAIRNVAPIDTLKDVIGKPSAGRPISTPFGSVSSGVREPVKLDPGTLSGPFTAGESRLVRAARAYLGVRYVYGGTSKSGMDCSGLVVLSFRDLGIKAPRFTTVTFGSWAKGQGAQRIAADFVSGDVVCRSGHMGIALGGGRLIHSPHTGTVVKEADMWDLKNWWAWRFPASVVG